MPNGLPTPDQIIGRKVAFFSIDTNVMEGKGFDFNRGALNVLQKQRPTWMTLRLSDIVEREVYAHRMRDLTEAKQKVDSALHHMRRKAALNVTRVAAELDALTVLEAGERQFKNDLQLFVAGLGGVVLPTSGETLASDMFERYFAVRPPFEVAEGKKFEFPDAAALLVLERYAKDNAEIGVLISNDKGWRSFANKSAFLFCVKTLEEFTALFTAMSDHDQQLLAKIQESLKVQASGCYELLQDAINSHVSEAEWSVDELYSESADRLEGDAYEASVVEFNPNFDSMQGWFTDEDSPLYVVELPVTISVSVYVSVSFYKWDSIDHEDIFMGSQEISVPMDIDVSVFFTSSGELVASPVENCDIEVEIAAGSYSVDAGEVNLDYGDDDD